MLSSDIIETFSGLLDAAGAAGEPEPTAMTLATATPDGRVSARTVLLKSVDAQGFVFYTNLHSNKGVQLDAVPRAALCFLWKRLRESVQVRVEGTVEHVDDAEADAYFATRPRASQIGAWASIQSATLPDRETLERRIAEFETEFEGRDVARPPHWSGFRVVPDAVEFWYGMRHRLHERHLHELRDGAWCHRMLYP